jgi:hypothetical protein
MVRIISICLITMLFSFSAVAYAGQPDNDADGVPFELLQMQILQLNERIDNMCSPSGFDLRSIYENVGADVLEVPCNDANDVAIGGHAQCRDYESLTRAGSFHQNSYSAVCIDANGITTIPEYVKVRCIEMPGTEL